MNDLDKVNEFKGMWCASYDPDHDGFYVKAMVRNGVNKNGKTKYTSLTLHKYIMQPPKGFVVDHINSNSLDNRRENLRISEHNNNSANRKGANSNNKTGVRNVNYIKGCDQYWVQIMKNGKRYHWEFPSDQFEEACKFAEVKRKEIYGSYAGNA